MTEKEIPIQIINRCGFCNEIIRENENWTESECILCESCNERLKEGYGMEEGEWLAEQEENEYV